MSREICKLEPRPGPADAPLALARQTVRILDRTLVEGGGYAGAGCAGASNGRVKTNWPSQLMAGHRGQRYINPTAALRLVGRLFFLPLLPLLLCPPAAPPHSLSTFTRKSYLSDSCPTSRKALSRPTPRPARPAVAWLTRPHCEPFVLCYNLSAMLTCTVT